MRSGCSWPGAPDLNLMGFTLHWQRVHSVPCLIQEEPVKRTTFISSRQVLVMSLRMVSAWQGSVTQRGQHSFSGSTLNSHSTSGHVRGQQSTSPCCKESRHARAERRRTGWRKGRGRGRDGGGSTTFTAYSVYVMDIYTQAFKATSRAMRSIMQLDCQSVLNNLNKKNSKAKAKTFSSNNEMCIPLSFQRKRRMIYYGRDFYLTFCLRDALFSSFDIVPLTSHLFPSA